MKLSHSMRALLSELYGLDEVELMLATTPLDGVLAAIAEDDRPTIPPAPPAS